MTTASGIVQLFLGKRYDLLGLALQRSIFDDYHYQSDHQYHQCNYNELDDNIINNPPYSVPDPTNVGAIVGGVIGGVAAIAMIAIGVAYFLRRSRKDKKGGGAAASISAASDRIQYYSPGRRCRWLLSA